MPRAVPSLAMCCKIEVGDRKKMNIRMYRGRMNEYLEARDD